MTLSYIQHMKSLQYTVLILIPLEKVLVILYSPIETRLHKIISIKFPSGDQFQCFLLSHRVETAQKRVICKVWVQASPNQIQIQHGHHVQYGFHIIAQ